jgi:hypothetical protein
MSLASAASMKSKQPRRAAVQISNNNALEVAIMHVFEASNQASKQMWEDCKNSL